MIRRLGFTIVELVITITIMAILMTIGVISLRSTQVGARDDERRSDIDNLARAIEQFYGSGSATTATGPGRYPSTGLITTLDSLGGIDPKTYRAPGVTSGSSLIAATSGVTPQPTISQYVYQPLQSNGSLCTADAQECRRFNLYYRLEGDNTVYSVTSKNQ